MQCQEHCNAGCVCEQAGCLQVEYLLSAAASADSSQLALYNCAAQPSVRELDVWAC